MNMPNWMRRLPHPEYGNWCGHKNTHEYAEDALPKDFGDSACMRHDFSLREAKNEDDKHRGDAVLWKSWKAFKPDTMYGKIYRRLILIVFKNKYCKETGVV